MKYQTDNIPVSFTKLNKGLNTNGNPLNINDQESSSLQNIAFDTFGSFSKRRGYYQLNKYKITDIVGIPMGLLLTLTYPNENYIIPPIP